MTATFPPRTLALFAVLPLLVAGCASRSIPASTAQAAHLTGKLHGGQQPVSGSTIQIFDASLGLSSAIPLLSATVMSDSNGNFSVTGLYNCPNASDQVYLVARGGDSGSGVNNDLILMTALGSCGDLTAATVVQVNEVTTVATVYAYADSFDPTSSLVGGYINGVTPNQYQRFLTLVDPTAGVALSTTNPDGQLKLDALANSVSACVNSPSISGVTQQCNDFITMAAPPAGYSAQDAAIGIYLVATNPGYGAASIFNFAPTNPPFQPTLSSAPSDWSF